jgi:hypothetical protein
MRPEGCKIVKPEPIQARKQTGTTSLRKNTLFKIRKIRRKSFARLFQNSVKAGMK